MKKNYEKNMFLYIFEKKNIVVYLSKIRKYGFD